MLERIRTSVLTVILMMWSTWVFAQTAPSGAPSPGASSPSGTTTSANPGGPPSGVTTNANPGGAPSGVTTNANPGGASGDGLNWIWIVLAVVVVAALLFYFLGRRRSRTGA
jgi:hypothetical protein